MHRKKAPYIFALLFVSVNQAFAAGGGHHGDGVHIPVATTLFQLVNVTILFTALFFILKNKVVAAFVQKRSLFLNQAEKSLQAKKTAEKEYLDLLHKVEHLEATKSDSISRAEAEATELKSLLVKEAQEVADRIRRETGETIQLEKASAQRRLFALAVEQSVGGARQILKKDISASDHHKLQQGLSQDLQGMSV